MVFLVNLCIKMRGRLYNVLQHISAQAPVFLVLERKFLFPIRKPGSVNPASQNEHYLAEKI
jgi:hypothetical protein